MTKAGLDGGRLAAVDWHRTKFGQRLLAEEQLRLDDLVRRLHGDVLLWSGPVPVAAECLKRCMVRRRLYHLGLPGDGAGVYLRPATDMVGFASCLRALPLPNNSIDCLVLHHSLETQADPRQALREVSRVIAPGGRLILCAFNGFSAWGLRALYGRLRTDLLSDLKFVNPLRLFDWLALLGFELEEPPQYLGYGLPLPAGKPAAGRMAAWLGRALPPVGAALLLFAVKQAQGANLSRPDKSFEGPELAAAGYPKVMPGVGLRRLGGPLRQRDRGRPPDGSCADGGRVRAWAA